MTLKVKYLTFLTYHHFCKNFDAIPIFPLTTSKTILDSTYKDGLYVLPHKLPNDFRLKILEY